MKKRRGQRWLAAGFWVAGVITQLQGERSYDIIENILRGIDSERVKRETAADN